MPHETDAIASMNVDTLADVKSKAARVDDEVTATRASTSASSGVDSDELDSASTGDDEGDDAVASVSPASFLPIDEDDTTSSSSSAAAESDEIERGYYGEPDGTIVQHGGIDYLAYRGTYLLEQSSAVLEDVMRFEARPSDVVLCSYMKTGTTWVISLILSIVHADSADNVLERAEAHQLFPNLERAAQPGAEDSRTGLEMIAAASELHGGRRLYNTHLPWRALPGSLRRDNGCGPRIVYVARNPKDTAVAWYHFTRHAFESYGLDPNLVGVDEQARQIMGLEPHMFGPFMEHVREFRALDGLLDNVLLIDYETMHSDYTSCIRRIASHIGRQLNDEQIERVADACRLKTLKHLDVNKRQSTICRLHNRSFFRRGQVGAWKEHFTVALNEKFDAWLAETEEENDHLAQFQYEP